MLRSGIRGIKQASPTEVADMGQLTLSGSTHRHPPPFHRGHWVPAEKMASDGALPDEPEAHVGGTVKLFSLCPGTASRQPAPSLGPRAGRDDRGLSSCLDAQVTSGPGAPPGPPQAPIAGHFIRLPAHLH